MTELCPFNVLAQNWPGFFGFWAQIFFGCLNQNSATISMWKIHIYIDSESFIQNGLFEIWPF